MLQRMNAHVPAEDVCSLCVLRDQYASTDRASPRAPLPSLFLAVLFPDIERKMRSAVRTDRSGSKNTVSS